MKFSVPFGSIFASSLPTGNSGTRRTGSQFLVEPFFFLHKIKSSHLLLNSRLHHDPIRIHGLTVTIVALAAQTAE